MIETRVCIDDDFGPFDCKLDPTNRWNGWLSPRFTLDTARDVAAQTLRMADEFGYDCVDTIHVIDGRADSPDTVHIIEGGPSRRREDDEDDEDGKNMAVAVRINWRALDRGTDEATSVTHATPEARKAAHPGEPGGSGAARAVVVHVRWQWLDEGSDTAANVVAPGSDGLYSIGGWEWTWHFASWWCACGAGMDWHEFECTGCELNRENQLEKKPCDCGCDPAQGVFGEYDLKSAQSRAHYTRTGRYLRWSESDAQPTL
ncbi:hypothetical protein ACFU93_32520 [Streptomyces sp. NPDC057611]|uniref:hypothetical protein n=1 Tax=Streptomyces sp. NPDC057611 TaxID=3346182 RepID=UPI00369D1532